jgi:hypothetical protein
MAPQSQAWPYGASGASTATWNGTTLTDTVTSGGAVVATFAGQCYANLNAPLPGWPAGNPV